jgi:hypothetical protein
VGLPLKNLGMELLTEEIELAIAWLTNALPHTDQWSGPAADACRAQIDQLLHDLRVIAG